MFEFDIFIITSIIIDITSRTYKFWSEMFTIRNNESLKNRKEFLWGNERRRKDLHQSLFHFQKTIRWWIKTRPSHQQGHCFLYLLSSNLSFISDPRNIKHHRPFFCLLTNQFTNFFLSDVSPMLSLVSDLNDSKNF